MGTENVLKEMAEYDLSAPIDVEIIFEDSDDNDDSSFQNAMNDQENTKDNNNNKRDINKKHESKKDNKSPECQINHSGLNKSMLSLNKNNIILEKDSVKEIDENKPENNINHYKDAEIRMNGDDVEPLHNELDANQQALTLINEDIVNNEENIPSSTTQINNHHEPITTFIEDLLNKLSEHIVLIMQSFYHYGVKRTNQDNKKGEEVFHFIKSHFFELSYTTVESIFLPQEGNESFINQFLDNTVLIANSKSLRWKCHRGHVLPFFKELIGWTKQKREQNKEQHTQCSSNENIMLKQQLIRPLLPLNLPPSEIIAKSNIATPKNQNNIATTRKPNNIATPRKPQNLCIFSSGTPGNEISINIDADTLIQISEKQKFIRAEQSVNHKNPAQRIESFRRNAPVARPTHGNRGNDIQKRNPQYDRPPPPPYNINHSSKNLINRPQQYNKNNVNPIGNYQVKVGQPHQNYQVVRQPQQNYQNVRQQVHSYPTQVQYINTNQTSPSHNDNINYLSYDNTNNIIPMHGMQIENQVTSSPVTTNLSSLRVLNSRCYMCGKNTSMQYDPYNPPCRPTYCSYLCRELDSQFYKPAWGNT